jgi:hypothetical protein
MITPVPILLSYDEHKLIKVHIFDVFSASQAWQEICQLQLEDSIWAELKT